MCVPYSHRGSPCATHHTHARRPQSHTPHANPSRRAALSPSCALYCLLSAARSSSLSLAAAAPPPPPAAPAVFPPPPCPAPDCPSPAPPMSAPAPPCPPPAAAAAATAPSDGRNRFCFWGGSTCPSATAAASASDSRASAPRTPMAASNLPRKAPPVFHGRVAAGSAAADAPRGSGGGLLSVPAPPWAAVPRVTVPRCTCAMSSSTTPTAGPAPASAASSSAHAGTPAAARSALVPKYTAAM
eukprot:scaffold3763_cov103-Isochrysis_galbana.AAC.3